MRLVQVNNPMESLLNERLRIQKAYSAANSLMLQLQIPQGNQLLYVLGYPKASDNKDAICQSILDQDPSAFVTNESYAMLKSKLSGLLGELSGGYVE